MYKFLLAALALAFLAGNLAVAQPLDKPPQDQPVVKKRPDPQMAPMGKPPQPPKGRPQDPIGENMFPPDLIMRCAEQIGLTEEQQDSIRSQMEKAQAGFKEFQPKLEQEVQAMAVLVKEDHPDTDKVLAQLDKVLAAEREVKRVQIALMVSLKNLLSADQQAQIQEMRKKIMAEGKNRMPGGDGPPPIQMKMMQVQRQMKELKAEGRDVSAVREALGQFESLMKEKKPAEAEAALDKALGLLGEIAEKK